MLLLRRLLPLAALAALLLPAAAEAKPRYRLGIGDQKPSMFSNPAYQALDFERVRYIVTWDAATDPVQRREVQAYMDAADEAGVSVLIAFSARRGCFVDGKYSRARRCRAPGPKAFGRAFRAFREAFPQVREYSAWNEANNPSQPIDRRPGRAADYFDVMDRACRRCRIVALDVLDTRNMRSYVRRFLRATKRRPRIFGLHNYGDVNRRRSSGTRQMLDLVPGQLWLTETGGIVALTPSFKYSLRRAARRTRDMFRLADRYDTRRKGYRSRITRLYPYQFTGVERGARFDAGLVNPDGSPRPAYEVFARYARNRRR